jgi:hypothetical protein
LGIIAVFFVFVIVVGVLATVGGPGSCTPGGGTIVVSAANASTFDGKWDGFDAVLDAGSSSSVAFSESEITSRADQFTKDEASDIKDVRICVHNGFGEVTGQLDGFLGIDVKFKAEGIVTLIGEHPEVDLMDIDIGNVPGFILDPFENLLEDAIEELLEELDLEHALVPILTEGQATIDGTP